MKLVYMVLDKKGNQVHVSVGDEIKSMEGEPLTVIHFNEPPSPASSGKVLLEDINGNTFERYVNHYGMVWVDREDRGEIATDNHPEVQMKKVADIYELMYGTDISGYNLDEFTDLIRDIYLGDFENPEHAKILTAWLIEQR